MKRSYALALLVLPAAGCGGGGSSAGTDPSPTAVPKGKATFTVAWPSRTRLVPAAANSLSVTLALDGRAVASRTIPRPEGDAPTTEASFGDLAFGTYDVTIDAFPAADGSGVVQATGVDRMTVAKDRPGAVTVSLASTAAILQIVPESTSLANGQSLDLTASARSAAGDVVLLAAGGGQETLAWNVDAATKATIVGHGPVATLNAIGPGSVVVHASLRTTDGGATIDAFAPVTIRPVGEGLGTVTIK